MDYAEARAKKFRKGIFMKKFEWGDILKVTKGRYAGTVGYYDDDEGSCLVIYPEHAMGGPYICVRSTSVKKATPKERAEYVAKFTENGMVTAPPELIEKAKAHARPPETILN